MGPSVKFVSRIIVHKKKFTDNWLGLGTPAILRQNPNKITILYGCGFGVKKIGLGQKKNSLGQNPNFVRKLVLKAPLMNDGQ